MAGLSKFAPNLRSVHASKCMNTKRVIWWNPYWAHCPAAKKKWASLLNRSSMLSVAVVAGSLSAILIFAVKWFVPQVQLLGLWQMAVQIPTLVGLLYLYAWLDRLIPARVVIKDNRIVVQRGEAVAVVYFKDVTSVSVIVFNEKMLRLSMRYRSKKGKRSLRLGLPVDMNLDELMEKFSCEKKVFDARNLFRKICQDSLKTQQLNADR